MSIAIKFIAIAAFFYSTFATAQSASWPQRPVRIIVSFAAGGSADSLARTIGQKLTENWGQQVIVDNKPGGNTIISAVEAARAAPDGYTLFLGINSTLTMNPFATAKLPYDPQKDYTPISMVANVPMIWVGNSTLPAKTLTEFVKFSRENPDEVTVGIASIVAQTAVEAFARDWGLKLRLVRYKSGVDITKALLGGEIQSGFDGSAVYPSHIKSGKLNGLATTSNKRLEMFSNAVPTVNEQGLQKTNVPIWYAVLGPAGMPKSLRSKIAMDFKEVLAIPEIRAKISDIGMEPSWAPGDELVKLIADESAVVGPLIKQLGIKID